MFVFVYLYKCVLIKCLYFKTQTCVFVRGVSKKLVTAINILLTVLIIIKYNKMFVDKYAIYTLSLVIFVYFNAFHIKPLLWQRTDDVKVIKNRVLVNSFMSGKMTVKIFSFLM